jgi:hypothetical protein
LEPFGLDALSHPFECGNEDLDDFFANDVLKYEKGLMAKTYTLSPVGAAVSQSFPPVGFISFCNDSIVREVFTETLHGSKTQWKKLTKTLLPQKRFNSLPAVKIARLGVQNEYKSQGAGTALLNMTKRLFLTDNRTGCRFLTVDAYVTHEAIGFYKKNLFAFLTAEEKTRCEEMLNRPSDQGERNTTVVMYYDLYRSMSETAPSDS